MDLYGDDRNLSELNEELNEFLDHDAFTPTSSDSGCGLDVVYPPTGMDEDWLDSFFEDPVLNDRMISDALQPPTIRHEHSYSSLANAADAANPDLPLVLIKPEPMDQDLDADMLTCPTTTTSQLNLTFTPMTLKTQKQKTLTQHENHQTVISSSDHIVHHSTECGTTTITATPTSITTNRTTGHNTTTIVKQPTIILATTQSSLSAHHSATGSGGGTQAKPTERLVLPKVNIKLEPQESQQSPEDMDSYHTLDLPPTPPSSTNSDSDGGNSPTRSAPSSPIRQGALRHTIRTSQTSIFSSPISHSGMLMLSEEERRTLISEGYPVPNKLPLTKQEEKNLKKIRRKIKNKISAQESRRKKKEYLETLEKKVEVYNQENVDLKRKMESLENNNRSLLSQLQKLQSIVSKVTKAPNSTQNTCLMVFVLCFAIFLGSWSPANFTIGHSRAAGAPSTIKVPMGPVPKGVQVDAYATANLRSRVLLSMKDEPDEGPDHYGPATPFSYRQMLVSFFHGSGGLLAGPVPDQFPIADQPQARHEPLDPEMPQVHISDAQSVPDAHLLNETGDRKMHVPRPDMTADVPAPIDNTSL